MDFLSITEAYYAKWVGADDVLRARGAGVEFVRTRERDAAQTGYAHPFDVYIFARGGGVWVSYGKRATAQIDAMKGMRKGGARAEDVRAAAERTFGQTMAHSVKYAFANPGMARTQARPLRPEESGAYLAFFREVNPDCAQTDWVRGYFLDMARRGFCCGRFADNRLVSCTDAPDMPYMAEETQEIGIHTLAGYRGRGYAAEACAACAREIIKAGKCPLWSAPIDNVASQRLAQKTGFVKFGDAYTLTLAR